MSRVFFLFGDSALEADLFEDELELLELLFFEFFIIHETPLE